MELSDILRTANHGDEKARGQLIQSAYEELRKLANQKMQSQEQNHTLTATALVNEASIKLLDASHVPFENRKQFFAYASTAMRRLLIDHARGKGRQRRGGDKKKFSFDEALVACQEQRDDILALNEALDHLAELKPRCAQVVEMRYFGGMSNQEVADSLGVSLATVKRDWEVAKCWLLCELSNDESTSER